MQSNINVTVASIEENKNPTPTRDELVTYDVESIYIEHLFKRSCVSLHTRIYGLMSMLLVLNYADSNLFSMSRLLLIIEFYAHMGVFKENPRSFCNPYLLIDKKIQGPI